MKDHVKFVLKKKVDWLRQIYIDRSLNRALITSETVESLIAGTKKRLKDHDRESIESRHDVDVNVDVDLTVNVTIVVEWWKSEEYKSEIAWEKSSLYTQI